MRAKASAAIIIPREQLIAEAAAERAQGREPEVDLTRAPRPILSTRFLQTATNA